MDSYTTVQQVADYLDRVLSSSEINTLKFVIPAASRWIDRALGANFDKLDQNTGATARYFKGGYKNINIDPCQNISLVQAINEWDDSVFYTYQTPLEYIAEPQNIPVKTYLVLRLNEFVGGLNFPPGDRAIKVTALFTGYDYANDKYPEDIVQLCNHISAVWLQDSGNTDVISRESVEGHSIEKRTDDILKNDPMVNRIMDSRKEIWLED